MDQTDVITHAALVFTELYRKSFASINLGNLQDLQNINNTDWFNNFINFGPAKTKTAVKLEITVNDTNLTLSTRNSFVNIISGS